MPEAVSPKDRDGVFHLLIPADLCELSKARQLMGEVGELAELPEDRVFDLQVAVSEAVANAIEHAASEVELVAWLLADRLIVEISNDGAFQPGLYKDDEHRRRGLGLPLMVSLADQVHVSRLSVGRTKVTLTFFTSAGAAEQDNVDSLAGLGKAAERGDAAQSRLRTRPATWLLLTPIPLLIAAVAVLYALQLDGARDSAVLLTAFNTLFVSAGSFIVAYLAARAYLAGGSRAMLFVGAGALLLGSAHVIAGPLVIDPNDAISTHNSLLFVSGVLFSVATFLILRYRGTLEGPPARSHVVVGYGAAVALVVLLYVLVRSNAYPVFWVVGVGPTLARDVVVGLGVVAFLFAALCSTLIYRTRPSSFVLLAGASFAMFAVSLGSLSLTRAATGTPINWTTRGGIWIGGLYLLAGVFGVGYARGWLLPLERSLRESEDRYRQLVNGSADAVLVHTAGRFVSANQAAAQLLGFSSTGEMIGRRVEDVLASSTRDTQLERIGQVYAGAISPPTEEALLRADGSQVEASVVRSRVMFGNRLAIQSVLRDITERREAEEALRRSEARFRGVFENTGFGIAIGETEGRLLLANQAFLDLLGYTSDELPKLNLADITHPEDLGKETSYIGEVLADTRSSYYMEKRYLRKDGTAVWVALDTSIIRDALGRPEFGVGIVRDITERKAAEEALRESEARLRRSQNIAHLGSWELDAERNELVWSDEVYRIFGLQPQEFGATYEAFLERVYPEDRSAVDAAYSGSLRDGVDSYEIEHRVVRKDTDEVRWVQERCEHMRNSDGRIIRSVGMVLDITGRKQVEEALRRSQGALQKASDQLEEHVRERTAELALANQELASAGAYARSLIEASLDPLLTIGPDGKITDVNEATIRITGRRRGDLIGTDFSDYFTDPERARQGYREVFAKGQVTDYPLTIRDSEGKLTDVFYNASVYRDLDGKVLGVFAAARDVTALKQLEEQRDIAAKLQRTLLDIPEQIDGVEFGHLYRSATKEASVGGDFYDVFRVKNGRVAVIIGDVSGHGVEAARIATLVKDVIYAFSHQWRRPCVVLRSANELLLEKRIPGFVTLFLGVLDPNTGLLTYSSAGHPNALLRTSGGEVVPLEAGSAPLGVFPEHSWRQHEIQLRKADLLLLYTDGAIEARQDGNLFGEERLADVLQRWSRPSPELLPRAILDEVLAFAGGVLTDDVAMLAIRLAVDAGAKSAEKAGRQKKLVG